MSGFTDQMMIQFLDDGFMLDFLSNQLGAQALFEAAYTPEDFTLHSATVSQVVRKEFAAPTAQ